MTFGEKVRSLRTGRRLSQNELGESLGVSGQYVSQLERHESNPRISMVLRISKSLGVDVSALFDDVTFCESKKGEHNHNDCCGEI